MGIKNSVLKIFKRKIIFNEISTQPISKVFGLDRGTPIDRFYIEMFLKQHASDVNGAALEIAESTYTKLFNSGVTSFEILHFDDSNNKATIIGDLTKPETLPHEKIDCFICTQTLNFIFDVSKAIEGSYKLLNKNGVFLGTVSGISQISRYDMDRWGDYWRFTDLSIKKLFEQTFGEGNVEVTTFGNVFAAEAFLKGLAVDDILDKSLLKERDQDYQITIGIKAVKR